MQLGPVARFFAGLPQESFNEIREARKQPGADQERLAIEDRRAWAREKTANDGLLGAAQMAVLVPAEQVAKGAMSLIPGVNAATPGYGRSGFHNPIENIGAGWTGILQGLNDRGLFGSR